MENCFKTEGILYFESSKIPDKRSVLLSMGVRPDTFAGNMVKRAYSYCFEDAINFRKEYKKYYRKEFKSLKNFIEERYNFNEDMAEFLSEGDYSMKDCSVMSIERNTETLFEDKDFKDSFAKAVGGLRDEDPNGLYYK